MKTIIQISDCHLLREKERKGYANLAPYYSLEQVLISLDTHADCMLITGDISGDDSQGSYDHFLQLMEKYVDIPWYVIPGNHDNNAHFDCTFKNQRLDANSPLELGEWCIHGLDTRPKVNAVGAQGEIDFAHVEKVHSDVTQNAHKYHLLALHHHILPSNSWMDKHNLVNAEDLIQWLEDVKGIANVIHGHVHSSLRQCVGKRRINSYGCPSTCWQWEMQPDFAVSNERPGYQVIELHDNGHAEVTVKRIN